MNISILGSNNHCFYMYYKMTTKPRIHTAAYNLKFSVQPGFSLMVGKVSEKLPIHRATAATDIADPRTRLGKISARITQTTGARVSE